MNDTLRAVLIMAAWVVAIYGLQFDAIVARLKADAP